MIIGIAIPSPLAQGRVLSVVDYVLLDLVGDIDEAIEAPPIPHDGC